MKIDPNLASRGEVLFQLALIREAKDGYKTECLNALFTQIRYAMVNESLVVVVLKMPRW
jgi:hypothetical protein